MAEAGQIIGSRYRLDAKLGQGSQGATWLATEIATGEQVAVKVFDVRGATDWKSVELFDRERDTLATLSHPGVPRFVARLDGDDGDGARYLVMEYVRGDALTEVLRRRGPLTESALLGVLRQAAGILAYLHDRPVPVVHRDIKPSNLLLREDGRLVLVDFGGVRNRLREGGGSTVVGTYGFMAPEQLHGEALAATDVFALGITAVVLGSGRRAEDLPRKGLTLDVDSALNMSPQMRALVRAMVAPDPTQRIESGVALTRELAARFPRGGAGPEPIAPPRSAPAAELPPGEAPGGPLVTSHLPAPLAIAVGAAMAIGGVLGSAALWLLSEVIVPLLFTLIGLFSKREGENRDSQREQIQGELRRGRKSFHTLTSTGASEVKRRKAELDALPRADRPHRGGKPGKGKRR
jgi:serine/threonine protein kinase